MNPSRAQHHAELTPHEQHAEAYISASNLLDSSKVLCPCGCAMVRISARAAYAAANLGAHGQSADGGLQNAAMAACPVECDLCGRAVRGRQYILHCPGERTSVHPFGFDLCVPCATGTGAGLQQTELVEPPAAGADAAVVAGSGGEAVPGALTPRGRAGGGGPGRDRGRIIGGVRPDASALPILLAEQIGRTVGAAILGLGRAVLNAGGHGHAGARAGGGTPPRQGLLREQERGGGTLPDPGGGAYTAPTNTADGAPAAQTGPRQEARGNEQIQRRPPVVRLFSRVPLVGPLVTRVHDVLSNH